MTAIIISFIAGTLLGVIVMSACAAAGRADETEIKYK